MESTIREVRTPKGRVFLICLLCTHNVRKLIGTCQCICHMPGTYDTQEDELNKEETAA